MTDPGGSKSRTLEKISASAFILETILDFTKGNKLLSNYGIQNFVPVVESIERIFFT